MKIAIRGGHTERCSGASGIINELTEDRKVKDEIISILSSLGHNVLDCTPPVNYTDNQGVELAYGVDKANNFGAELFISIHFNNAYNTYNGAIGTETVVYSGFDIAERIVNNIANLGFKNRGVKEDSRGLYELKHTKMKAVIVECCFVEATEDVALYKKVGPQGVAKAIVEGILNSNVNYTTAATQNNVSKNNTDNWVVRLQKELNVQGYGNLVLDGIPGPKTLGACPVIKFGAQGNITRLLQEKLGISVDGIFGNITKGAVMEFQRKNGLIVDGIIGTNTWRKLLGL